MPMRVASRMGRGCDADEVQATELLEGIGAIPVAMEF